VIPRQNVTPMGLAPIILVVAALLASYIPARRAARSDPKLAPHDG
jgi:ABC-type lipoprotein release transport system permease subunit